MSAPSINEATALSPPLQAKDNQFAADLDDAEKGSVVVSEKEIEGLKRGFLSGRNVSDGGSSKRSKKSGGEADITEREKIESEVVEWRTASSSDAGTKVQGRDEKQPPSMNNSKKEGRNTIYKRIIHPNHQDSPLGWPRVASFMNSSPSFAIWRRFGTSHNRILLHLESTITKLEQRLLELDISDSKDEDKLYRLRRNEYYEGWDPAQKEILEELRIALNQYDELLLKDNQLRSLPRVPKRDYLSVFNWMYGEGPIDIGEYNFIYHQEDFVSSGARSGEKSVFDGFIEGVVSRWTNSRIHRYIHRKESATAKKRVHFFSSRKLTIIARLLVVCLCVAVLLIPIFLLSLINMSNGVRLSVVLIFTMVFAVLMALLMGERPGSVFVGTCTYAAVLVVFCGGVQGRSGGAGS